MTSKISIVISTRYVTVDEFDLVSSINHRTVKRHTSEGKLPIRKKQIKATQKTKIGKD